ncbi:MAG: PIN domain-containing protein [Candidatus Woesearchaeota archaeon]
MVGIILDTNFLLLPYSIHLDSELERLFGAYTLHIVQATLHELDTLSVQDKKKALMFITKKNIDIINGQGTYADDAIVQACTQQAYVVATQDKLLKKRLKEMGITVVGIRAKQYITIQ